MHREPCQYLSTPRIPSITISVTISITTTERLVSRTYLTIPVRTYQPALRPLPPTSLLTSDDDNPQDTTFARPQLRISLPATHSPTRLAIRIQSPQSVSRASASCSPGTHTTQQRSASHATPTTARRYRTAAGTRPSPGSRHRAAKPRDTIHALFYSAKRSSVFPPARVLGRRHGVMSPHPLSGGRLT
ncbi:uncharacterized protein BKA78DRAFT_120539 [Phyllosticta capitalensis]|uniref:uncharacterized protein n=1 Tax=Phyllosticta capitalensis TaxID=121624 RepID=UPI0031311DD1